MANSSDVLFAGLIGAIISCLVTLAVTPPVPKFYPTPVQVCSYLAFKFDTDYPSADSWDTTKAVYQERDCPAILKRAFDGLPQ